MVAVITTNISSLPQAHRISFKISCHRRLVELPVSVSNPHREKLPRRDAAAPSAYARFAPASKSQRGSAVGVAHQFLNDLYVLTIGNQKRGIAMPESIVSETDHINTLFNKTRVLAFEFGNPRYLMRVRSDSPTR
jgi:hypothetical protein